MMRSLNKFFLYSIMVLLLASLLGADGIDAYDKTGDDTKIAVNKAPLYGLMGAENPFRQSNTIALGAVATSAPGIQVGTTTFDFQHNGSMGRQIEHRNSGLLHFDWTVMTAITAPFDRGIGYQIYDFSSCDFVYPSGGIRVNTEYSGYVNLDVDPGGCGIPAGHEDSPIEGHYFPRAYWDDCNLGFPTQNFDFDQPADIWGGWLTSYIGPGNENIWPVIEWQVGTENVLHMVCTESGGGVGDAQTISYYRRLGGYGAGAGSWSGQRVIDTVMVISPVIVASQISDKVAVLWNAPADILRDQPGEFNSQYFNDVWFAVSTNQGVEWISNIGNGSIGHEVDNGINNGYDNNGGNITIYGENSGYKAYTNISAVFIQDDNLHAVWNCRRVTGTSEVYRRHSGLFHWSLNEIGIDTIIEALWDEGNTEVICEIHSWGCDVDKPIISECDDKLYVLFAQFGNSEQPCYDIATSNIINGELFITGSADGGHSWTNPFNLTSSVTNDCGPGECDNDYWPTMARYGRIESCGIYAGHYVLDILYINDKHAGGVVHAEGTYTINPVMWLVHPCFPIEEDTCTSQNPGDVNDDDETNSDDVIYLRQYLRGSGDPLPMLSNADVNGDCRIEYLDADYLESHLDGQGPAPVECTCLFPQVCDCKVGDANNDGTVNIGDAVYIGNVVFHTGSPLPVPYNICSGDANSDCSVNVGDVVYIINIVFHPGAPLTRPCHSWIDTCGELHK